ncbi:hypothetical protein ACQEVF_45350 [Nonomuraea polychroma]|uniref:hypothetical protein n=1 Tax=Nonomuraea polychroma TaxID=46176 RepID=UPI003D914979
MEHDSPTFLFDLATEYLMAAKTIRTDVTTLAKMVVTARTSATAYLGECGAPADRSVEGGSGPAAGL